MKMIYIYIDMGTHRAAQAPDGGSEHCLHLVHAPPPPPPPAFPPSLHPSVPSRKINFFIDSLGPNPLYHRDD